MFRTGLLSIIRSLVLYTQQQVFVMLVDCLLMRLGSMTSLAVNITRMTNTYCCVYGTRLLTMDSKHVRNMYNSIPKQISEISTPRWFLL